MMDPLTFLRVARDLRDSAEEAGRRTSVGRSYYAVFNYLRLKLEQFKRVPETDEAHQIVVQYLMKANNPALSSVGQDLHDLRATRRVADYDMAEAVGQDRSAFALRKADKAIEKFAGVNETTLKAAIEAQATIRSRRETGSA